MSKSAELTRKDMKEPDKFQVAANQAASWIAARKKAAIPVAAGAVVVVLAVAAFSALSQRKAEAAGAALSGLYQIAGAEISSVPLPGVPGPFYPSEDARQKAVAEAAAKLVADFTGTRAAALASLALGDAKLRLGDLEAAAAAYQAYLAAAPREDALRFGALEGLALVEEGKGNVAGALTAWGRFGAEAPAQADRADLEKARVLEQAGRADEAKKLLAGFADAHKESPLTGEAAERLAKLGGK
ncbi:MAG TPA: tetratricopeptide repeat protein [Anaeromyxobacteraceae bacterium]|nr:tetratricopeptide repeat protein [Anaeromyxobacteraceae bacterium]